VRKIAIALSVFALAAAGFRRPRQREGKAPAPAAPDAGSGSTVSVAANPSGELAYAPTTPTAKAGKITIDFANESQVPHDVVIERAGKDLDSTDQITGSTTETTIEIRAGTYMLYCSVPGHGEGDAQGAITVAYRLSGVDVEPRPNATIAVPRVTTRDGTPPPPVVLFGYRLAGRVVDADGRPLPWGMPVGVAR
jgi:plastocyanin